MTLRSIPKISLDARPPGLKFKIGEKAKDYALSINAEHNKSAQNTEIEIFGAIGDDFFGEGITASGIKKRLKDIGSDPVTLLINSPGGDAFEGIAIYNLLREHKGKVSVNVIGIAASAASIIAMAGDHIKVSEAAMFMIHSAWGGVFGNQEEMTAMAEVLNTIDTSAAALYSSRTGIPRDEVLEMMRDETWLDAQASLDQGFADEAIVEGKSVRNKQSAPRAALPNLPALGQPGSMSVSMSANLNPGASGKSKTVSLKGSSTVKTIKEQITEFEAKRAATQEAANAIMKKSADEGRTLEVEEDEAYEGHATELAAIDKHIARLKQHETTVMATIEPVNLVAGTDPAAGAGARQRLPHITVKANVEKGIGFTRYVKALAMARGNEFHAAQIAKANQSWTDQTPEVGKVLMAAVAGGDTTTSGWASELVYNQNLVADFIELLRPATIIGKITNLRNVPFNVRMSGQTSGSSSSWVGQGAPTPVSALGVNEVTLGIAKAAGLVVLTDELVRSSSPSAEMLVRNDLRDSIAEFLDVRFVDPTYAEVTNVSPASITNGVTPVVPSGVTAAALRADVQTLFGSWIQSNLNPAGGVWIMSPTRALAISLMRTALDQPEFTGITMMGGTFFGLPVVVSNSANIAGSPDSGDMIILANAPEIMLADEGGVTIDASREASLEMLDNPTNNAAAGTPTTMVSMFQTNSIAIKATRYINWKKRRSFAVQFIQDGAYVA